MITFPNAKINLGLNVTERRPDGYHNIETVFLPVAVTDVLEIVPAQHGKATTLATYGRPVECEPEKNLVMKAARLMQRQYDVPELEIHLTKVIPHGAGLGGGSSDATFTLLMLNEMFNLGLDDGTLAALAATLGADCPFFVYNRPMLATGIGDQFTPVEIDLTGKWLYLVKPKVYVPTAQAYAGIKPEQPTRSLAADLRQPLSQWQGNVKNDFEPSVFALHPVLADIKKRLLAAGAEYAAMSGSGSSMFAICPSVNVAEAMRGIVDAECDVVSAR